MFSQSSVEFQKSKSQASGSAPHSQLLNSRQKWLRSNPTLCLNLFDSQSSKSHHGEPPQPRDKKNRASPLPDQLCFSEKFSKLPT